MVMFNVTHSERSPTMTSTKDKPAAAAIKDLLSQSPDGLREVVRAASECSQPFRSAPPLIVVE